MIDGAPQEKIDELNDLMNKIGAIMKSPKGTSPKELKQVTEILKRIKEYSKLKDKSILKNYLIHTKNELSNANG